MQEDKEPVFDAEASLRLACRNDRDDADLTAHPDAMRAAGKVIPPQPIWQIIWYAS